MNARWFPARGRRAIVLLPHWNSDALAYTGLCRVLNLMGISVLRLSLPYHDIRMPADTHLADYAVSANIGRTLDACRQAVIDVRCCLDWLEQRGCNRLGILGTSLGSCYAFLATAQPLVNVFHIRLFLASSVALILVALSGYDGVTGMIAALYRSVRDAVSGREHVRYGSFVPEAEAEANGKGHLRVRVIGKPVPGSMLRVRVRGPSK